MKKLTILFLVCLFTNVALISAYDHPIYGDCKPCKPSHKEKGCDVCCCIDHISAATERGLGENGDITNLFTRIHDVDEVFLFPPFINDVFALTFEEQLTKSGDSITLVKPNTFLFNCPGQYCVEFSGCAEAGFSGGHPPVALTVNIVFLVDGQILQPTDQRFVFTGDTDAFQGEDVLSCFSKSAVVQTSDDCVSCNTPVSFQVAFVGPEGKIQHRGEIDWEFIHYSIKITHITDSKCKIAPLNP